MQPSIKSENQLELQVMLASYSKRYREVRVVLIEKEISLASIEKTLADAHTSHVLYKSSNDVLVLDDLRRHKRISGEAQKMVSSLKAEVEAVKNEISRIENMIAFINKKLSEYGKVYEFKRKK